MIRHILFTLALLSLPCASAASVLSIPKGQTVTVNATKVTLVTVLDSRCLPRALCLMAGNVQAKLLMTKGKSSRDYTVFLPGKAVSTLIGTLTLKTATRRDEKGLPRLTFTLN